MTRTRLYLDVDGVINAEIPPWDTKRDGYASSDGVKFTIRWSPDMIDALKALDVELVWATTWTKDAPRSIAPLIGFGADARFLSPPFGLSWPSIDWKARAVAEDQRADPSPFIWADDEISAHHIGTHPAALVLAIDPIRGITPANITAMTEYIAANEAAA